MDFCFGLSREVNMFTKKVNGRIKDNPNGFPKHIGNKIINKTLQRQPKANNESANNENLKTIYFNLPYIGVKGEQLTKTCIRKLKKCFRKDIVVHFKVFYETTKITYFTNNKDPTPLLHQSNVVYEFKCPGCNANYVGKTERTLWERTHEHGWTNKDKPVYQHLTNCSEFQHILTINQYNDLFQRDHSIIT